MLIEQPPLLYRLIFPEALWRLKRKRQPTVYITFDDGPIPEVTPKVLDILQRHNVPATFFMVGDNVRRHPELLELVRSHGHSVGNHTMHHLQGLHTSGRRYLRDVAEAHQLIDSPLFRPPHGILRHSQMKALKTAYNIVMYDVVTRDYSRHVTPAQVLENVQTYTRNGSIIVFHDSLKARNNMLAALPVCLTWLREQGYAFAPLPME